MKKAFQHMDKNNNATYKLTFGVCNVLVLALNENTESNLSTAIFGNSTNQDSFLLVAYRKFATSAPQATLPIKSTTPVTAWGG